MRILITLLILLSILMTSIVYASTIHGTIYDLSLKPLKNILVEVDSQPPQKLVSKDGAYQFSLQKGQYTIKAKTIIGDKASAEEKITIIDETGDYRLDLFLLPEETGIKEEKTNIFWYITPIIALIIIFITMYAIYTKKYKKPRMKEETIETKDDLEKIINIIKQQGGRITQKELRKHFPLSEAKVSLMITELEAKGKIEKIKKGRGNVIILK